MLELMLGFFRPKNTNERVRDILEPIQSIKKLEVKENDIIVLRYPVSWLSEKACDNIKRAVEQTMEDFGFRVKVLVLVKGMDIEVLTKETT
jgi:hypothetical protein